MTNHEQLIEHVAEAMWRHRFHREFGPSEQPVSAWTEIHDSYRHPIRQEARAAIAAVREYDVEHGPSEARGEAMMAMDATKSGFIHSVDPHSAIGRAMNGAELYSTREVAIHKAHKSRTGRKRVYRIVIYAAEIETSENQTALTVERSSGGQ